jgi:2-polyprenyl-6-methoxyphenol hydroxylase-like FAD-dependent oxidoreductase
MDVLISGAGIAGPNLAWWLLRGGHRVTIVEQTPALRTGGYIIDFWGKGYDLAERMGLLPRLEKVGYHVEEVRFVGDDGNIRGGFSVGVLDRVTKGRFISLPRSELSAAIFAAIEDRAEVRFGEEIVALAQDGEGAAVRFASGAERRFDMVVGAEGIRSPTRELTFGPEERFERFLGYAFAAYTIEGYARRDPDVYLMHGEPGRLAARFTLHGGASLALLIWRDEDGAPIPADVADRKATIRRRFTGGAWEVPALLEGLDRADDLYLDRVSQIRMDRWHDGRIGLVGDAAYAPSFLAGQGSALAMIGGYVLAGELARANGDVAAGFAAYERRLMDFMIGKQDGAVRLGPTFVPMTELGVAFRAFVSRLLAIGPIANLAMGRSIRDDIELPDYFPEAA